jgi:hypothetical protein
MGFGLAGALAGNGASIKSGEPGEALVAGDVPRPSACRRYARTDAGGTIGREVLQCAALRPVFRCRRNQRCRPMLAKIMPGSPAPATGPGMPAILAGVRESAVHTIGGVIMPGEPVMLVVPETDVLMVEIKIAPQDIDQLHFGQPAMLRFSAFNQRTTPQLTGSVVRISADVVQDQKSGTYYYTVRISVPESELERLHGLKLIPGMPVEALIKTTERKALSYLIRPIHDQVMRAFRDK